MPEEPASPAVEQEEHPTPDPGNEATPQEGAPAAEPAEGSDAPETDWQERYANLQPEYTRATQEAAQLREYVQLSEAARQGNIEAQAFLAENYEGWDPPETDTELADEDERIARLEQTVAEQQQAQQQAQEEAQFQEAADRFYDEEFSRLDPESKWSEEYKQHVDAVAQQHYRTEDGIPDLETAHKAIQSQFEDFFKQRVESKRSPQAPSGAKATHEIDLDDPEVRKEWMLQQAMGNQAA